jgi:signal transduction histidine kinase/CheY-like chemotaxis protein
MIKRALQGFFSSLVEQRAVPFIAVFAIIFLSGKLTQYIFFTSQTSPAVIWPTPALTLAAVLLGGYRLWAPIALAQLAVALASPSNPPAVVVATSVLVYTIQPLVGAFILNKLRFDHAIKHTRDALLLVLAAVALPMLGPTLVVGAQMLTGSLAAAAQVSWTRSWAGGVLSTLILVPLIMSWSAPLPRIYTRQKGFEFLAAMAAVIASVYLVFWTALPRENVFLLLSLFLAVLFWVGLRLGPRAMSLALFVSTGFGMLGSVIAHPISTQINQQLFADELFMILLSPIFLILSVLVEERRVTAKKFEESVEELREAFHRLELEDRSKNEFIATLAHELRNPLAPVMSTLELLKLERQRPDVHLMIETAQEQLHVMRRLLDDLLDVARVTQKNFKLQKEPVTLQSAVNRALHTVEAFVNSRGHTCTASLPPEPVWLYGDPVRLTQIFTNILYNAAKYTDQGGRIELGAKVEGADAVVFITDNGIGIDQARLERIFDPFVHTAPKSSVGTGLGIGLSLTKRLVEMHHGRVEARSPGVGRGSTFVVRLPLGAPALPARKEPQTRLHALNAPYNILVVDDNEAAAQGIEKLLSRRGHRVTLAYDGASALSVTPSVVPDIVLLDIGLPDIDGYEVARQLRREKHAPYLVALTGYGQSEDKARAHDAGFSYHLTKPVGLADIEHVLHTISPGGAQGN